MLIPQIWINRHPKMFVYLCWFDWSIIKVYNWVQWDCFLPTKYNFLSLFIRVKIKVYFPFKAQLPIFSMSSLRSLAEVLISWTTENREMSSANSLVHFSDQYLTNNKGPRIDPWGTTALTSAQDEQWLFKTTLRFLLRRDSRKILMISPLLPLKKRPSCNKFKSFIKSI